MKRPPEPPPMSPCIRVCRLDADGRYCTGCFRTTAEIAQWWAMRDDEKRAVLAAVAERKKFAARP